MFVSGRGVCVQLAHAYYAMQQSKQELYCSHTRAAGHSACDFFVVALNIKVLLRLY